MITLQQMYDGVLDENLTLSIENYSEIVDYKLQDNKLILIPSEFNEELPPCSFSEIISYVNSEKSLFYFSEIEIWNEIENTPFTSYSVDSTGIKLK